MLVGFSFYDFFVVKINRPTNIGRATWSLGHRVTGSLLFLFFEIFGSSPPFLWSHNRTKSNEEKAEDKWCHRPGDCVFFSLGRERESVAYRRPTRVAAASVELSFIETFVAARIETSRVVSVGSLWCSQGPSARTWESGPSKNRLAGKQAETGFCCLV
jgi:hypothetical protein